MKYATEEERREARRAAGRKYYKNNTAKVLKYAADNYDTRQWKRKLRQYGLSDAEFNAMWEAQDGKCAICPVEFVSKQAACVDHCHKTDLVRGLLCRKCNSAIGFCQDNVAILERAVSYLKKVANG